MPLHRRSPEFVLCVLFIALSARAAEPIPLEAARAMVDAERNFYQTGQEKGTRAAFLAFLADDGIVFRPGPLNGKEVWEQRPETGFDLIWEPTFATMSRSGDFGYDTGPAKWRANKKQEKFTGHGQFISIWKKQADGSWKVALDLGIENPEPTGKTEALRILVATGPAETDPEEARKTLREAQQQFADAAKAGSTAAALALAARDIRVYRDGHFPSVGKASAGRLLKTKGGKTLLEPMASDLSPSADLAYTYGKYSLTRTGGEEQGHYFQIWQTDASGSWKLVLDWQQALPVQ